MEVELKLLIDPSNADAVRKHPLLEKYAASEPYEQDLAAIYFDTPDNAIRQSGAGLRVRRADKEWIQTFKAGGNVIGGLHQRHEWETRVPGPEPDLTQLAKLVGHKGRWGKLLRSRALRESLRPVFSTHVKRSVWELRLPEGDELEFVFDQGTLELDDRKEPISEIEIELKSGNPSQLLDFALKLQKDLPLKLGNDSKADRGYALRAEDEVSAVKATRLELSKAMTIEQAFQAIAQNCIEQIQANEHGVSRHHDTESLHQMRIGLRRLRSALAMFDEVMPLPQEMQQALAWLGGELGAARDWDVLANSTLAALSGSQIDGPQIEAIKNASLKKARTLHEAATAAIDSPRYTRFMLSLTRWIQCSGWRDALTSEQAEQLTRPLLKFAGSMLRHDRQRLAKRGSRLTGANPEARHRVRIAAKKMRYDTEFFQSLLPQKEVRSYVKALSQLQDRLGWLNDVAVADSLLKELQCEQPKLTEDAAFLRGYLVSRSETDERNIHKLWKRLESRRILGK